MVRINEVDGMDFIRGSFGEFRQDIDLEWADFDRRLRWSRNDSKKLVVTTPFGAVSHTSIQTSASLSVGTFDIN